MDRRASGRRRFRHVRKLFRILFDQDLQRGCGFARSILERLDQLRHDAAQIADQRHVEPAVDADGGRVLLHVHPFAVRIVAGPMLGPAVVHRLTELGTQRNAQVGFLDCLVGGRGEQVGERPLLQSRDERGPARGLDHRAGHELGQLLDLLLGTGGMYAVAHQQDWALGLADQLHGLGQLAGTGALVDQPVA